MNKHQNFVAMPVDNTTGKLSNRFTDPRALHVLLWCPNLPRHRIVFDGERYWMFQNANWQARVEFKGAIPYLRLLPAYSAFTLELPFKIRKIVDEDQYDYWYQYVNSL